MLQLTGTALWKRVNRCLVRIRIGFAFFWEFLERNVQVVVCLGNVLLEMLAWQR